jgi:Raf kinase inhibitor-like YbhB/YbcL family protein
MRSKGVFAVLLAILLVMGCKRSPEVPAKPSMGMTLASPAFADNGEIPAKYGCSGGGQAVSPPLTIGGVPASAKSLALMVDDPDAPGGTFTHWLVWNIAPATTTVAEGLTPAGASEGKNGYGKAGWGAPCPPSGEHHYVFTLYALDTAQVASSEEIPKHAVAQAKLVGRYARK